MRLSMTDIPRFFKVPVGHFFLLGPRGTGKTWWTRRQFPEALRVDLLDPATLRVLAARPERLRELMAARPGLKEVVLDEVQKLPELLEVVHGLIEERAGPVRFVLTGSSARKLRREGVNLLGGRAASHALHPYMAAELGGAFELESALRHGLLPVVLGSEAPEEQILAYNGVYLREEIQAEGLVCPVYGGAQLFPWFGAESGECFPGMPGEPGHAGGLPFHFGGFAAGVAGPSVHPACPEAIGGASEVLFF